MQNPISEAMRSPRPGFRFHPDTDELLLGYLKAKILGQPDDMIPEIDLLKHKPWELYSMFGDKFGDEKHYFFCRLKHKYSSGDRCERTTKDGYWKQTRRGREIMGKRTDELIGKRDTLVFHESRRLNGKRTSWAMHEFHLNRQCLGDAHDETVETFRFSFVCTRRLALPYVVCRIMNNKDKKAMRGHAPPPLNQEGDCLSFRDNQHNEVVAAPREMSVGELMESLPPPQPLDDILSYSNTTTAYQQQAGTEQGSSSLFGFSRGNDGIGLDFFEPL